MATATITIDKQIQSSINITPQTATSFCQGGSVNLNAGIATNYSYQWLNNGAPITSARSATYKATSSGIYSVIVNSNSGCIDTSLSFQVLQHCVTTQKRFSKHPLQVEHGALQMITY
jgi:hypothetical protein